MSTASLPPSDGYDVFHEFEKSVRTWISAASADPDKLARWLKGFDLPPFGSSEPYFRWVLRTLDTEEPAQFHALAQRLGNVLRNLTASQELDVLFPTLSYNALSLAQILSAPTELASPLQTVLTHVHDGSLTLDPHSCTALLGALIENQIDSSLRPLWMSLLNEENVRLPGNVLDGFDGIRMMPSGSTEEERGSPSFDSIGIALLKCSTFLNNSTFQERRREFRTLVTKIINTYPGRSDWYASLLSLAEHNEWPLWAIESLPFVYYESTFDPITQLPTEVVLWDSIASCIPSDYAHSLMSSHCQGQFVRLKVSAEAAKCLHHLVPMFLIEHAADCGPSVRAFSAVVLSAMSLAVRDARKRGDSIMEISIRRAHTATKTAALNA